MKQYYLLLFLSITACNRTMEPEVTVTPGSPSQEKIKLDRFLNQLQSQLKKEQNPLNYLQALQLFASKLLVQHFFVERTWAVYYFMNHLSELIEKHEQYAKILGLQKEEGKFFFIVENNEQLNELLAHSNLLDEKIFTPDELKTIFLWIIDPQYGDFFHKFGLNRLSLHEGLLTREEQKKQEEQLDAFANSIFSADFQNPDNDPKIIKANTEILIKILQNVKWYATKLYRLKQYKKVEEIPLAMVQQFSAENRKIIDLYRENFDWYKKIYHIIRKEIDDIIRELIQNHEPKGDIRFLKTLQHYTLALPEAARIAKQIPEKLPAQLPDLVNPKDSMPLPSVAKELEQFRVEWQKTHPKGEEKKEEKIKPKKVRIKKPKAQKIEPLKSCPSPAQIIEEPEEPEETEEIEQEYQENKNNIIIYNPENQTIETIYKTDKPFQIKQELPPIKYTRWVNMWFKNPSQALCIQGYTTPGDKRFTPDQMRWRPVALHAFSPLIDSFIKQWGTLTKVPSKRDKSRQDLQIAIPGKITYKNGNSEAGLYIYLIDSGNGQWYHRMFEPQKGQKLIETYLSKGFFMRGDTSGYYDEFFPLLGTK